MPTDLHPPPRDPIYGPIRSWRFGNSLGIDLLLRSSICSFSCVYCQLGKIEEWTAQQDVFVATERVVERLRQVDWAGVDVATFSGSGEPTLALNLGDVIREVKRLAAKPVIVLTNATLFLDPSTRNRVLEADRVVCKLDAGTQDMLETINRPVPGIRLDSVVEGIRRLREEYSGTLALQCMFLPGNAGEAERIGRLAASLRPDEIQVNTPRRVRPRGWVFEARGRLPAKWSGEGTGLPTLSGEEVREVESTIRRLNPKATIVSVLESGNPGKPDGEES